MEASNEKHQGKREKGKARQFVFSVRSAVFFLMILRYPGAMVFFIGMPLTWKAAVVYMNCLHGSGVGTVYLLS